MSTPRVSKSPTVPALIAKLGGGKGGGLTFKKALAYDSGKPGGEFVWTTMETMDQAAWNRQADAFRALAPGLRRSTDHWSLSLDPRLGKLTRAQWEEGARAFLDDLGYQGCIATVYRHTDEPQDHIHISVLRLRFGKDGEIETVSDSHIYKRSHIASERAARKLGLKPLPQREDAAEAPAPTDSQVAANQRAKRHGTPVVMHAALAKAVESAVVRSTNVEELVIKCAEIGIEVEVKTKEPSMAIQGLRFKPVGVGVEEWTKASELKRDRSLSWAKLEPRLLRNSELRARAHAEAARINAAARESAAARVAAHLAHQPEHQVSDPARALMPVAVNQAKEATMLDDKLDFLNLPPKPRPEGQQLDDAELRAPSAEAPHAGRPAQPAAQADDELLPQLHTHEQEVAWRRMRDEIRKLTNNQLLDLRKPHVSDLFLLAAMFERLLALLLRCLSLGLYKSRTGVSDALAARERLAELAEDELAKRRKSPATAALRLKAMSEHQSALTERDGKLEIRERLRKRPDAVIAAQLDREREARRSALEASFERRQVRRGHDTLAARKKALALAAAEHVKAESEPAVATGFGMALMPRRAAKSAADAAAHQKQRIEKAIARRAAAQEAVDQFLQEIETKAAEHDYLLEQARATAAAAEAQERIDLARELRELPAQIQAERDAQILEQRPNAGSVVGTATAAHVPPSVDEMAAEDADESAAEREALRWLGRGG